jgi:hypothetical protein
MSEAIRVNFKAATASGLEMALQNVPQPPENALAIRAATGRTTSRLR